MDFLTTNKTLKRVYIIGGVYDLVLGISILFFPDTLTAIFAVNKPDNMVFVYLTGLFLILVGYFLIYAAINDATKYIVIGMGSVLIRFSYALIIVVIFFIEGVESLYLLTALTDTLTGLMILIPILKNPNVSWKEVWI